MIKHNHKDIVCIKIITLSFRPKNRNTVIKKHNNDNYSLSTIRKYLFIT